MKNLQQEIQRRLNKAPSKNDILKIHARFFKKSRSILTLRFVDVYSHRAKLTRC